MTRSNRRNFLRLAASAGAVGANAVPGLIQKALAIPAHHETGTIRDVRHIVILMQENRSFDHYFGTLKGVRGFGDPRPAALPNGKAVWHQPHDGGELLPFHPDAPNLGLQFLDGTPHDWTSTQKAWNGGRYDQWVAAKGSNTMAYFTRQDIPFHYALADAFTVCDAYHCSLMGPTDPNRYHLWTGWAGNDGSGGGPVVDNAEAGYGWSTYPERLTAAGISWKVYQDIGTGLTADGAWGWTANPYIGNYGDNALLYFHQYQDAQPGTPLHAGARTGTNVAGDPAQTYFDILRADVARGTLPQVSYIVAPEAFSEHPNWAPNFGAWYTAQVLDILTSNAELWSQTALFITYDENDGFFDHMVPPTPAQTPTQGQSTVPTTHDFFAGSASYPAGPFGMGQRVPMIVVSPWTRGGWVCSEVFDHTSLIRFIERRFGPGHGLRESNITPWRRAVAGDLTSAFDFARPNDAVPALPATAGYLPPDKLRHDSYVPIPPSVQAMPGQERGLKWSRALPYDLAVHGRVDAAHRTFALDFANRGDAGAVFRVSTAGSGDAPRTYTVEPGKALHDTWTTVPANGRYAFVVTGPGAFHREFAGDAVAASARASVVPEARVEHGGFGDDGVRLLLSNEGTTPVTLTVAANAYVRMPARRIHLAPGQAVEERWPVAATFGWYDLSVTCDASPAFLRRAAGRVENGRPRVSDPATA
ncbi:MAG: phosphocholine-specific phospholipase C [Burkholderiaceae bacterium]